MSAACLCEPRIHLPRDEGSEFEIVQRTDWPAVLSIGLHVTLDRIESFGDLSRECFQACDTEHGLGDGVAQRTNASIADRRVLQRRIRE